jgi:LPXTG-motif cell wall-anchored protein
VKIRSVVALSAVVLLLNIAVGGPAFADASVSIIDFDFSPSAVTISVGETVTWTNDGEAPHTSSADGGEWDSGTLDPGDSFSNTFDTAGTFAYHCNIHPDMTGTVTVTEGGGTTEPGPSGTLPATGSDSSTGLFVWMGFLFLLTGGVALFLLRRRRQA